MTSEAADYEKIKEEYENALLREIDSLTEEELIGFSAYAQDKERLYKKDPLLKHSMENDAQERLLKMRADYRVLCGANKVGKTYGMAFILVALCKGRGAEFGIEFPHRPPLKCWYCGRDRNVLSDEPLTSIKTYLKGEGIDYKTKYSGQTILSMEIWDDELGADAPRSLIWFKPYSGEKRIFESSNLHLVLMDEEPPKFVFDAVKTKIGFKPGVVYIAMTPDDGITWTYDLFEGTDPDHGELITKGQLELYEATVFDNLRNFPIVRGEGWVRYPEEYGVPLKPWGEYRYEEGVCYIKCPDSFERYVSKFTYGSQQYLMRILGRYISFTGRVYPFDAKLNTFRLHELPPFEDCLAFGSLDWGYGDPCCYVLWLVDRSGTHYAIDGFYTSKLDARDQAKKIREISEYWGFRPLEIVADDQIDSRLPQADKEKKHIVRIKDYYYDELGYEWTYFRTDRMDKLDAPSKREKILQLMKSGKIKLNPERLQLHMQEMQKLEFKAGRKDLVKGEDHFDSCLRYYVSADYNFENWFRPSTEREARYSRRDEDFEV